MVSPVLKHKQKSPEHKLAQTLMKDEYPESRSKESLLLAPPATSKKTTLKIASEVTRAATASKGQKGRTKTMMNSKSYRRLDCIGKGGSARVYRVIADDSRTFALKKVSLRDVDEIGVRGFKREIELLTKLGEVDRVVRLIDWELNDSAGYLNLVCTQW